MLDGNPRQPAGTPDDTLHAVAKCTSPEQSALSHNLRTLEGEGLIEIAIVENRPDRFQN
jgi:hypothetical protein